MTWPVEVPWVEAQGAVIAQMQAQAAAAQIRLGLTGCGQRGPLYMPVCHTAI